MLLHEQALRAQADARSREKRDVDGQYAVAVERAKEDQQFRLDVSRFIGSAISNHQVPLVPAMAIKPTHVDPPPHTLDYVAQCLAHWHQQALTTNQPTEDLNRIIEALGARNREVKRLESELHESQWSVRSLVKQTEEDAGRIAAFGAQVAHQSTLLIEKEGMIENLKAAWYAAVSNEEVQRGTIAAFDALNMEESLRKDLDLTKSLLAEREKFKAYVHLRLDERGIGKFENERCRIGHRLDVVFEQVDTLMLQVNNWKNLADDRANVIESWRTRNVASADGLMKASRQIEELTKDLATEKELRHKACEAYERIAKERGGKQPTLRDLWAMALLQSKMGHGVACITECYAEADQAFADPLSILYGKPIVPQYPAPQVGDPKHPTGMYGVNLTQAKDANHTDAEAADAPTVLGVDLGDTAGDRSVEVSLGVLPDDDDEPGSECPF